MELDFKILTFLSVGGLSGGEKRGKYLRELLEAPFMVFAWVVAWEIRGCDIRDCFGVDAYYLCEN